MARFSPPFAAAIAPIAILGAVFPNAIALAEPTEDPFALPTEADAIEIQQQQSLTLEEALELGQKNSPLLQAALGQLRQSQASWREVRAQLRPTLKLESEFAFERDAEETIAICKMATSKMPASSLGPPSNSTILSGTLGGARPKFPLLRRESASSSSMSAALKTKSTRRSQLLITMPKKPKRACV